MKKMLIICGPTATGKTKLAVGLAKQFDGELVSADSRQVYRFMDIATGKDKGSIDVPIWGIDLVHPDEEFSVSQFVKYAEKKILEIFNRKKTPILVGGTGFYITSLMHPPESLHVPPDMNLREELKNTTVSQLQRKLDKRIVLSMNESDRNNPRRLIRKIELQKFSLSVSSARGPLAEEKFSLKADALYIGLTMSYQRLYDRIDTRVEERLAAGVKKEVDFLAKKYPWDLPSMQAIGYKEWKHSTDDEALRKWKFDEHAYARRQMTWFKKNSNIHWFDAASPRLVLDVEKRVRQWYTGGTYADEN
jgi:tRNA dimethylallyltransferase